MPAAIISRDANIEDAIIKIKTIMVASIKYAPKTRQKDSPSSLTKAAAKAAAAKAAAAATVVAATVVATAKAV
ncbi:MAG: hypothetical protein CO042_00735, partial [Parcubacteria group bacterium CG_4_9_14_0_2_um_filter_41_8]